MFFLWICISLLASFMNPTPPADLVPKEPIPEVQINKMSDGQFECILSKGSLRIWQATLSQKPNSIALCKRSFVAFGWYDLRKPVSSEKNEHWIVAFSIDVDGIVNEIWRRNRDQWVGTTLYPLVEAAEVDDDEHEALLMIREQPGGPLLIKRFNLASLLSKGEATVVDDRLKVSQLLEAKCIDKSSLVALVWWVGGSRSVHENKGSSELVQIVDRTSGKIMWDKYLEGAWGMENVVDLRAFLVDKRPLIHQDGNKVLIRKGTQQKVDSIKVEVINVAINGDQVTSSAEQSFTPSEPIKPSSDNNSERLR